jgi:hypothetical protein
MAHEPFVVAAHPETEAYIHANSPEEVVTSQPTGETSSTHERLATLYGNLDVSRYFSHAVFRHRHRLSARLEHAANPG